MEDVMDREISDEELEKMLQRVRSADQFDASPSTSEPNGASSENGEEALTDEFGFPFEPEGLYNSAPIEFEEITKALWTILVHTNYTATRYNRLSPYYTMLMQRLEKDIKQMGSYCITKAVLEQSGQHFPELDIINVKELYQMVSVHFRKCCMAYNDLQKSGKGLDMALISRIFRWAALAERLKATQDKINNIQSGKIKIESLLSKESVYKGEIRNQRDHSHHLVEPGTRVSSLPILKSFTGEVKTMRREEERRERALQRESEKAKKRLERELDTAPGVIKTPVFRPKKPAKLRDADPDLKELRKLLMDDAKARGNMAEAGIIALEQEEQLIQRFRNFRQSMPPDQRSGPALRDEPALQTRPPTSGPSSDTRKKLREKRKKKK